MSQTTQMSSARAKELRRLGVAHALASSRLEGLRPTPSSIRDLDRFVEGKVSREQLLAEALQRHGA